MCWGSDHRGRRGESRSRTYWGPGAGTAGPGTTLDLPPPQKEKQLASSHNLDRFVPRSFLGDTLTQSAPFGECERGFGLGWTRHTLSLTQTLAEPAHRGALGLRGGFNGDTVCC